MVWAFSSAFSEPLVALLVRCGGGIVGERAQGDLDRLVSAPFANELQRDRGARRQTRDVVGQRGVVLDDPSVDLVDVVLHLDAGLGRGAVLGDIGDHDTLRGVALEGEGDIFRRALDLHAEPAARDLALAPELGNDRLGHVDRHREADARVLAETLGDDQCVHADDLAAGVQKRTTGVARD